jgi:anti-sigma factor RsiW
MGPDQQRLTPTERADLVAYLDGELGDADARAIATKLSNSATARREVESLEKAWELLDHLPRPRAAEAFTARTRTEIARREVEAGELGSAVVRTTRRLVRALIWMVMSLLAFGLGYVLTQAIWPNPSDRLTRELPIAEHLEEYRDVGTFEFLQELVESPEFNADRD